MGVVKKLFYLHIAIVSICSFSLNGFAGEFDEYWPKTGYSMNVYIRNGDSYAVYSVSGLDDYNTIGIGPCYEWEDVEIKALKTIEVTCMHKRGCDCGIFDRRMVDCYDLTITYRDGTSEYFEGVLMPNIRGYVGGEYWQPWPRGIEGELPNSIIEYEQDILKFEFME